LLAAGRGQRLRPFTDHTPKPLLRVHGRPTLDYVLSSVAHAGIRNVCIVTHHLEEQIRRFAGDGSHWGLTAVYSHQSHLSGTAHALQTAVSAHPQLFAPDLPFLLTATDYVLSPTHLAELVAAYLESDTDMTISLKRLPPAEIAARSSVRLQDDGCVSQIIEKPGLGASSGPFAASLIFVLPAETLDYLPHMKTSDRGEFEIQSIINQMLRQGFTAGALVQEASPEWDAPQDRDRG
jgi:dTDP-glucose pyrophosphorylase